MTKMCLFFASDVRTVRLGILFIAMFLDLAACGPSTSGPLLVSDPPSNQMSPAPDVARAAPNHGVEANPPKATRTLGPRALPAVFAERCTLADPVATVNGEPLAAAPFVKAILRKIASGAKFTATDVASAAHEVLNSLIDRRLLRQAVRQANIRVSRAEVDAAFDAYRRQYRSPVAFQRFLAQSHTSQTTLRSGLRLQIGIRTLLIQTGALLWPGPTMGEADPQWPHAFFEAQARLLERLRSQGHVVRHLTCPGFVPHPNGK